MATYKLSADEILLIYLTFLAQDEEGHPEYLAKWFSNGGQERLKELFNNLKEKGVILKDYNPLSYIPNDIQFNKNFIKSWLKNSNKLGIELFTAYPTMLYINGKYMPLRNITKSFSTLDDFYFSYSTQISHNPETHKKVMEILDWAKKNNKINYGICEFVLSHKWEELAKLKQDGTTDGEIQSTLEVYDDE